MTASSVSVTPPESAWRPSTVSTCIVRPSREKPTAVRGAGALFGLPSQSTGSPCSTRTPRPPAAVRGTGPPSPVRGAYSTVTGSPTCSPASAAAPASRPRRAYPPGGIGSWAGSLHTASTRPSAVTVTSVTCAAPATGRDRSPVPQRAVYRPMPPSGTVGALWLSRGSSPVGRVRVPAKYRERTRPAPCGPKPTTWPPSAGAWTSSPSLMPTPVGAWVPLLSKKSPLIAATTSRPSPGSCAATRSSTVCARLTSPG